MARESTFWDSFDVDVEKETISIAITGGYAATLNVAALTPETQKAALYHGLIQKIRDAACSSEPVLDADGKPVLKPNGKPLTRLASVEVRAGSVLKVIDNLRAGQFISVSRTGDTLSKEGTLNLQARAYMAYGESIGKPRPFERFKAFLKGMSEVDRATLMAQEQIRPFWEALIGARTVGTSKVADPLAGDE